MTRREADGGPVLALRAVRPWKSLDAEGSRLPLPDAGEVERCMGCPFSRVGDFDPCDYCDGLGKLNLGAGADLVLEMAAVAMDSVWRRMDVERSAARKLSRRELLRWKRKLGWDANAEDRRKVKKDAQTAKKRGGKNKE